MQIKTGEGKSLIVALIATMQALQNKKVDVITTSTELSVPEVKKMKDFFKMLNVSVAENSSTSAGNKSKKKQLYQKDIVYGQTDI